MKTLYMATATNHDGREGHVSSDDGILDLDLGKPGSGEDKTNPEQLFAAAYAASYGSALKAAAGNQNIDLGDFTVTASVELGTNEEGEQQLSLTLDSYLPGVDVETGEELVDEAYELCPFSRATMDNMDVTLNLLLDEE
ncbi:peroxiredoxin, Ohr subfamily [Salinimicrobium catena]|uniref:Peroxiredoxin, Ohr subfamily n=1 Tax=Salinimicrobium catena TaxID=390640 RepID=A0A1H5NEF4_9FLAO|nr:Ohr family peroxiredoxin [Salinimicrobium catena]SDL42809.1 peroxiredoxin, Ohr subfamily [Salinimicrobium catena]SEE99241.1 peroxiredoxin, Ohr subfamily [Salinimicrobium catena]